MDVNDLPKAARLGFLPSENAALNFILRFLKSKNQDEATKMAFLKCVIILCSAVKSRELNNMDYYCSKAILAERVEMLILEEPAVSISSMRQQAMFCIMEMSRVDPKFQPLQRMELIQSGIFSLFSLPPNLENDNNRDIIRLYSQTVRALDEMLQGLMTETENPSMLVFVEITEIIMPWILSNKIFERIRALSTLCRQLRFISSFPELRHVENFKIGGNLMVVLGLFCMDGSYEVSSRASEALHYFFKFFVNQRQSSLKNEEQRCKLLKDLQKDFQSDWTTCLQYIVKFFQTFLNPEERATVIILCVKAMTAECKFKIWAPVEMLERIIDKPLPELDKVSDVIESIHYNLGFIRDLCAIQVIEKTLQELTQKYTDEVMLMLITIQDRDQDRKLWKILAAPAKGYDTLLNHLLMRLQALPFQDSGNPSKSLEINPVLAGRALNELLLDSSSKLEVEIFYPWLFMALLSLISFLVFEGGNQTLQELPGVPEYMNPVSCTIETLKTLICSAGYEYQVSFMKNQRTWELLANPEEYLKGISMIAKSLTIRSCWHIRPIILQKTEVAIMTDETIIELLKRWAQKNDPVIQQLVLKAAGNFGLHKETTKFLRMLQPCILNCCFSKHFSVVEEAFLALRGIICNLTWTDSVTLLIEISCILRPFFDDESEELRYRSVDMFGALLAKVKKRFLMAPFRYQVHCSLVPLMLHIQDENTSVANASRDGLFHAAKILVCPRFKSVCINKDMFTIGMTLLEEQKDKIPWFLSQSLSYFHYPQSGIRLAAVWLTTAYLDTDGTLLCRQPKIAPDCCTDGMSESFKVEHHSHVAVRVGIQCFSGSAHLTQHQFMQIPPGFPGFSSLLVSNRTIVFRDIHIPQFAKPFPN
ncbi:maestro heat-like repeat family member 5 isoform X3 [Macrotis lagotis]|uniref:maestro heat-like repeat family member 5 isoform X3 n=1 Tax=Macrotis lagotis TaxID=92651 RepID=UPI003D688120